MEMMQENKKIRAKITPVNNRSLRPNPLSSGIEGMLTPPSKRMVVLGMGTSVRTDWNGCGAIPFYYVWEAAAVSKAGQRRIRQQPDSQRRNVVEKFIIFP